MQANWKHEQILRYEDMHYFGDGKILPCELQTTTVSTDAAVSDLGLQNS